MTIQTNTNDRKALARAIAEELHTEARYLRTPTYAYKIGEFTVDRYGNIIADMFDTLMPDLGYMDEKSIIIQVEEDDDGLLTLNEDDMSNFDMQIIPYDFE